MANAFTIVKGFESELAEYTGAPFVVAVDDCTFALRLAFAYISSEYGIEEVILPERTYRSVANMAYYAGLEVMFDDREWQSIYNIGNTNIWDCALQLVPKMYKPRQIQCLSFHPQKPLACSSGGGAILHDDPEADRFFRLMRYDGRNEGVPIQQSGWEIPGLHGYMFPVQAAEAWHRLDIFKMAHPGGLTMPQPNYENIKEKWNRCAK